MKIRVFELAKKYKLDLVYFIDILINNGIKVNSHLSGLSEKEIEKIEEIKEIRNILEKNYIYMYDESKKIKFLILHRKKINKKTIEKIIEEIFGKNFLKEKIENFKNTKIYVKNEKIDIEIYNKKLKNEEKQIFIVTLKNEVKENEKEFEKLKFKTRDILLKELKSDSESCFWLEDYQVEKLSRDLYLEIHRIENSMRRFVLKVMLENIGLDFFLRYLEKNKNIKKEKSKKESVYDKVNQKIYNFDINSVFEIINLEKRNLKLNLEETAKLNELNKFFLNKKNNFFEKEKEIKEFILKLHLDSKVEFSMEEEIFRKYFPDEFKKNWNEFKEIRNCVMHNKLISYKEGEENFKILNKIKMLIKEGEEKFEINNLSINEKNKLKKIEKEKKYKKLKKFI